MAKKKIPEEWSKRLTPELRECFGTLGKEVVEQQVADRRHMAPEKHFAALAWLDEQRQEEEQRSTARHWMLFTVAVLTFIAVLLGFAVTKGML